MRKNQPAPVSNAVLMCHAPIVLPEIGADRASDCIASTRAMIRSAEHLVAQAPDVLVLISPHTPRDRDAFGIVGGEMLAGDFGRFGFPEIRARVPNAPQAATRLIETAQAYGVTMGRYPSLSLDHGAMVPLHFMVQAGWGGPTLVISLPYTPTHEQCRALGVSIAQAAQNAGQEWAVLASGDMSHRLIPGAPAGFNPKAVDFDHHIVECVRRGDLTGAVTVDPALRELAAEDVVDTLEIAASAIDFSPTGLEVLSYEGPFGVGYLVAILQNACTE
ncbi:MAG: hypothetical protein CMH54_12440 [Myxococcales bacterium]|nr:hypothetical protein [Myxococcales bacterium]